MTWTMLAVRFCVRWDVAETREEAECVWYDLERRPQMQRWLGTTCRASWKSDISILAHRIFRGERRMLYPSQYSIPVVASLA